MVELNHHTVALMQSTSLQKMKSSLTRTPQPKSILLIGPPGGGKTTLLMQFPGLWIADCDLNLDGPEKYLKSQKKEVNYHLDTITLDDNGKPVPIHECFQRLLDKLSDVAKEPTIQTVAIDGLTMVNEFIIQKILKEQSKTEMEVRHWQPFKSAMINLLVGKLRGTGKSSIVTCHEVVMSKTDPKQPMKEEIIGYKPAVQSGITDFFGGFFTDMWRCTAAPAPAGKTEFTLTTGRTNLSELKNSMGLPNSITNPTYQILEPYLTGIK